MRQIKFRTWDGIRMTTSGIAFSASSGCLETPKTAVSITGDIREIHWPIMQFTGIKDKNGVEIYEGDIVLFGTTSTEKWIVEWEDRVFPPWYSWVGFTPPMPEDRDSMEVIGNIHENPELLESGHE